MRVKTVGYNELKALCAELASKVVSDGFVPDTVLGIKSGGTKIAAEIFSHMPSGSKLEECTPLRDASEKKKHLLGKVLKYMPLKVLDCLRVIEARSLFSHKRRNAIRAVDLPEGIGAGERILVVDDAVDSGATLEAVMAELKQRFPAAKVKSAALTVTSSRPCIMPDYFLFHDEVLLRFPWSMDAKS